MILPKTYYSYNSNVSKLKLAFRSMLPTHRPSAIGAEWPAQTPSYLLHLTAISRPSLAGIVALLTVVLVAPFAP